MVWMLLSSPVVHVMLKPFWLRFLRPRSACPIEASGAMARALLAVALTCAVCSPLAFSVYGVPKAGATRSSEVSFRGSVGDSSPASEATAAWVPTFLVSAALGLM
eukprot:6214206-Amphidinium_carterae.1